MFYFYILQSEQKLHWFYKGSTNNLQKRFEQHSAGEVASTKPYLPVRIVYYEAYSTEKAARHRESSVKNSGAVWGALMGRVKASLI